MHEQLRNSQQPLPHLPLVCCLLSPCLECSAHHASCHRSPEGMPVSLPDALANIPVYLSYTQSIRNGHISRACSFANRLLQAQTDLPIAAPRQVKLSQTLHCAGNHHDLQQVPLAPVNQASAWPRHTLIHTATLHSKVMHACSLQLTLSSTFS